MIDDPRDGVLEPALDVALYPALSGLEIVSASHLPNFKNAIEAGGQSGWSYYFPYLVARNRKGRSAALVVEDEGSLCVFLWRKRRGESKLDLLLAPTPMNPAALKRCLERANDFNRNRSARVMRIEEQDAQAVAGVDELRLKERGSQYLYAPKAFLDLGGRKFRTLRRNVAQVEARADVEVLPYSASHREGCRALLARWSAHHREAFGTGGGVRLSRSAIELAGHLPESDLHGEVVLVDGTLSAFAFGGEIRPGVACFFDAKSDIEVPGLSYFHRYSYLSKLQRFDIVNDGSSVGRSGLSQLKESLRPVGMLAEYGARQRGSGRK